MTGGYSPTLALAGSSTGPWPVSVNFGGWPAPRGRPSRPVLITRSLPACRPPTAVRLISCRSAMAMANAVTSAALPLSAGAVSRHCGLQHALALGRHSAGPSRKSRPLPPASRPAGPFPTVPASLLCRSLADCFIFVPVATADAILAAGRLKDRSFFGFIPGPVAHVPGRRSHDLPPPFCCRL